jgi:ATP-dependent DNA helicase RecG
VPGNGFKQSVSSGQDGVVSAWMTAGKILSQELRSGCADKVVIGGLEKYVERWSSTIYEMDGGYPTRPEAAQVVRLLAGYSGRTPEEREAGLVAAVAVARQVVNRLRSLPASSRQAANSSQHPEPDTHHPSLITHHSSPVAQSSSPRTRRPSSVSQPSRASHISAAIGLEDPIVTLRGIGKLKASKLAKLGIEKVKNLLTHYPRDYRDYSSTKRIADLMYGESVSVVGLVEDVQVFPSQQGRFRTTVKVRDSSGRISATWFRYGYGGVRISPNTQIAMAGTVTGYGSQISLDSPDWELAVDCPLHTRRLVPVYPLTEGVSDYWLREIMAEVVPRCASQLEEYLPPWVSQRFELMALPKAMAAIHFPKDPEELARARFRLAFDELFLIQVAALKRRAEWQSGSMAPQLKATDEMVDRFLACQPFTLTGAQRKVTAEIRADLASCRPMTRLLEGEVGSGKTIVAAVALLSAVSSGYQGALMAPTEILAEQHARTLQATFGNARQVIEDWIGRSLRLEVLTGASKRSEREAIHRGAESGDVDILVGTQAIIQEGLDFKRLGLAIVDEQHRFGVVQRTALRQKGGSPHLLVMTATPIPRTLALTLYGDLDLSVIDELPPGRQKVKTHLLGPTERDSAYEHIRREAAEGRQAFIICPLVEDNPSLEVRAATAEYERLRYGELAGLRLALLHGRMRPSEKDRIMLDFRSGEHDVLVSTSVVEVGIDVPNATVMLVEGAERFGLAQLHQFRGRVGRGAHASSCILLTDSMEEASLERLRKVEAISDGFRLADEDLKLRGPGEYLGVRQSGFPDLRMADLQDLQLIEMARGAAAELIHKDPGLEALENRRIGVEIQALQRTGSS